MPKKIITALLLLFSYCSTAYAIEYQSDSCPGEIHATTITKGWCGNIGVSTKVGKLTNGKCVYEKETQQYGHSSCHLCLNGGMLAMNAGKGYTCAATHIHSNVTGSDVLDEFILISNADGRYINSQPAHSEVELDVK